MTSQVSRERSKKNSNFFLHFGSIYVVLLITIGGKSIFWTYHFKTGFVSSLTALNFSKDEPSK